MTKEINLLPPPALKERLHRLYRKRVAYLMLRAAAAFIVIWGGLLGAYATIYQAHRLYDQPNDNPQSIEQDLEQQVLTTSQVIKEFQRRVESRTPWTPHVQQVLAAVPAEVSLQSVAINADRQAIEIKATSTSRAAIVEMQQRLEALPWVAKVEAPLRNFATGNENTFSFTLLRHENPS